MNADLTLSDLHALVAAAAAKSGRTMEDIGANILPHAVAVNFITGLADIDDIDLTDPGTARMLVPLIALCHGVDPGPGGRACMWSRNGAGDAWVLRSDVGPIVYCERQPDRYYGWRPVVAPAIAAEPDDLAALVAACKLAIGDP